MTKIGEIRIVVENWEQPIFNGYCVLGVMFNEWSDSELVLRYNYGHEKLNELYLLKSSSRLHKFIDLILFLALI